MNGSKIASQIDSEYRRNKYYENRKKSKKKDDEFLEKMVEEFVEEMKGSSANNWSKNEN